ncbi:MAG: cobalamin-dependent protein [Acidobacteriota bacterium]|nr:cobalamin-dependent protein [Acidobacteriota bacterium]
MRNIYTAVLNAVPFLPYVHGLLQVYAQEDPVVAEEYRFGEAFFLIERPEAIVERMEDPAILCLSCYVWNFRKQMKIARLVKQRHPDVLVVAGGPHVPNRVGDFLELHPYVDLLIHGEGEIPFRQLLRENLERSANGQPDWSRVGGLSFLRDGELVHTGPGDKLPRDIPLRSPYTEGLMNDAIELCREKNLRFYAPWETNRGCPFSCSFCDWGSATMSKVRRFEDLSIQADVEFFGRERVPNVFICDANFGILPRDVDIAHGLVRAHQRYGFPKQVRVNFAKNSNDRVFEISRSWAEADMLMGTTLSMQSTNLEVLEAIDRKNIGIDRYTDLKERYAEAGIHTYTELILGLPKESGESFKRGIGSLLEAGNHEDLRVYEFDILPNAPINDDPRLPEYRIQTVEKTMYLERPGTPQDEVETVQVVFETAAMSREDWVDASVFAQMIQFLHNGCYTRYLSIHLRRRYGLAYYDFYEGIQRYFLDRPESALGEVLGELRDLYRRYQRDPKIPQINLIASQPQLVEKLSAYGRRRGWTPDDWGWLCLAARHGELYDQLAEFIEHLGTKHGFEAGEELEQVLRYQREIMLQPDYDPEAGREVHYDYDFPAYLTGDPAGGEELAARPVTIRYRDRHMGVNRQYEIRPGDLKQFAKAAIGESYPFVRIRHYQHQLEEAEIEREPEPVVAVG